MRETDLLLHGRVTLVLSFGDIDNVTNLLRKVLTFLLGERQTLLLKGKCALLSDNFLSPEKSRCYTNIYYFTG